MSKNLRLRFIGGDLVALYGVRLGSSTVSLRVKLFNCERYLVATKPDGRLVTIAHRQIFYQKLPKGLDRSQQNLWRRVRAEFASEILEVERTADMSWARTDVIHPASDRPSVEKLGPYTVDIVLPFSGVDDESKLVINPSSYESNLRLVENTSPENIAELGESTPSAEVPLTDYLPRLKSCHLTALDKTIALLYWPSAVEMVLVLRTKTSERLYCLTLKHVPVGHQLHYLFEEARRVGSEVSVQVGLNGLFTSPIFDPTSSEQFFAQWLAGLGREPGQEQAA